MLSDDVLLKAGHYLYACAYADHYEEHGGRFAPGCEISEHVDPAPGAELLAIMRAHEARMAEAWGRPVEEVCELLGLATEAGQVDVVYYALMQAWGHGVSLHDSYRRNLDQFERATGVELKLPPYRDDEMREIDELAWTHLETPSPEYGLVVDGQVVERRFHSRAAAIRFLRDSNWLTAGDRDQSWGVAKLPSPAPVCEVEIDVKLFLPEAGDARTTVFRALNRHHYGAEEIPLDVPQSKIPRALVHAAHLAGAVLTRRVKLKVFPDGSFHPEFVGP